MTESCKQCLLFLPGAQAGREQPRGPRVSVGHRSLAWQQLRCSLTRDNWVPPLLLIRQSKPIWLSQR